MVLENERHCEIVSWHYIRKLGRISVKTRGSGKHAFNCSFTNHSNHNYSPKRMKNFKHIIFFIQLSTYWSIKRRKAVVFSLPNHQLTRLPKYLRLSQISEAKIIPFFVNMVQTSGQEGWGLWPPSLYRSSRTMFRSESPCKNLYCVPVLFS